MKLLTKELIKKLPKYGITENIKADDKILHVKLFCPWSNWTWYLVEYGEADGYCFGYVEGFENEWGCFSLPELEAIKGPFGLKIERDLYFKPIRFGDLAKNECLL